MVKMPAQLQVTMQFITVAIKHMARRILYLEDRLSELTTQNGIINRRIRILELKAEIEIFFLFNFFKIQTSFGKKFN